MRGKPALLIVDVQRAFPPPARFLSRLERYVSRFPKRVFTRFVNPPGSNFRRNLHQKCCAPGSSDTELLIEPRKEDLVITKSTYGLQPAHIRQLKRRGIRKVIVCGLDTDACVMGVMFSLFDAGIECHLKPDLCWSSSGLHRPACRIIEQQFPEAR